MSAKKKVLLVDDDYDVVEANRIMLEHHGYTVVAAYNGRECVEMAQSEEPDIIVLDVMMNTLTEGFHVVRDLRRSEQTRNIPILMLTAIGDRYRLDFEPDDTWLPVDAFMAKPGPPARLLAEVGYRLKVKAQEPRRSVR